ncbi:MAG: SDR family NAD(P)-dependent oxidoreductase [Burkholderiales bacterium]
MSVETAVIVGAGPGLGSALARRFAQEKMQVAVASRKLFRLEPLARELIALGAKARAYACDATDEASVASLFSEVGSDFGVPDLVVYNAGAFAPKGIIETSAEEFERCWKVLCYGGFLTGREAVKLMLARKPYPQGTIIFTGATASLRGSVRFHNLAVGKFGLRALAQSMAREFQPQGIHVAHVVIDGQIAADRNGYREVEQGEDAVLDPAAIAETYYQIHRQPRSAWTLETDLRPWVERF